MAVMAAGQRQGSGRAAVGWQGSGRAVAGQYQGSSRAVVGHLLSSQKDFVPKGQKPAAGARNNTIILKNNVMDVLNNCIIARCAIAKYFSYLLDSKATPVL